MAELQMRRQLTLVRRSGTQLRTVAVTAIVCPNASYRRRVWDSMSREPKLVHGLRACNQSSVSYQNFSHRYLFTDGDPPFHRPSLRLLLSTVNICKKYHYPKLIDQWCTAVHQCSPSLDYEIKCHVKLKVHSAWLVIAQQMEKLTLWQLVS